MSLHLDTLLKKRRILITCGTGGVGKTTMSAAIAMRAAILGKRTVVITIDPAKRLATSLGLKSLGDEPTDLTAHLKKFHGKELEGSLHAIVPDTKRTFETFFRSLTPSKTLSDRLLENPIFQIFAREFSGSNEYMALQRLFALDQEGRFDCIILDTPPSRNTLDFLNAPKLLSSFFEANLIQWLVVPANKIVQMGMKKALGLLEKLTGAGFMTNLLDFVTAIFEVRVTFNANLKKVMGLMESEDVGFIAVSGPNPDSAPELKHFLKTLHEHRFRFDGLIVNRTLSPLHLSENVPEGAAPALKILKAVQKKEKSAIEELSRTVQNKIRTMPELARDVHSMEDLHYVAMALDSHASSTAQPGSG